MDGTLGTLVRRIRQNAAMSQEVLAERSGVSVRTISDLERGVRSSARFDTIRLLAEALELSAHERSELIEAATSAGTAPYDPVERRDSRLPTPPNALIGRESLVADVVEKLASGNVRLLTLTGPGGIGKTRVAIEVASQRACRTDEPSVFVSLAAVADPSFVPVAVSHGLGVTNSSPTPEDQVLRMMSRCRMLLVLDNFEHLVDAGPFVARLVNEAPEVSVLVTSRTRLRLTSEVEFSVPPLDLPMVGASAAEIRTSDAVRLFVERAATATNQPDFPSTSPEVVAAICRRVEGLPLGLELAASRLRVMSAGVLLDMLDHRLNVLTGGHRDQAPRQQSMRATIGWSYGLLDRDAQVLFRWLAVFVGGFSSHAAATIGQEAGLDAARAFAALESLLDSGLVKRSTEKHANPRFRMLETLREFGVEQLTALNELDRAHLAFARCMYDLVADGAPLPGGELDLAWYARVETEDANVLAAFDWACEAQEAELAVAFCASIGMYWEHRDFWRAGADRMSRALSLASLDPGLTTTKALYYTAGFLMATGDYATAKEIGDIALQMARDLGDRRAVAYSLVTLGWNAELREEWSEANRYFEDALHIWTELGECGTQGKMQMFLGGHAYVQGDYATARRLQESAASKFAGNPFAVDLLASTEYRLGCVDAAEERWHDAAKHGLHSLRLWSTVPTVKGYRFQPFILLADVAAAIGEFETAAKMLGCCDHQLVESGGVLFSHDKPRWSRATTRARDALGDDRYAELHASGRELDQIDGLRMFELIVERSASAMNALGSA